MSLHYEIPDTLDNGYGIALFVVYQELEIASGFYCLHLITVGYEHKDKPAQRFSASNMYLFLALLSFLNTQKQVQRHGVWLCVNSKD